MSDPLGNGRQRAAARAVVAALLLTAVLPASAMPAPGQSSQSLGNAAQAAAATQPVQAPQPAQAAESTPTPQAIPVSQPITSPQAGQATAPLGRKRIGLALGGGGALGLSEIGVLRWMEENHVPVDVIAGTSMGSLIAALYATNHTPQQMSELTSDKVFSRVFRISADFRQMNFRRREDQRFLPGGLSMGLKKGPSLRNAALLDYGLNQFLNAQFLPYGADFTFDNLPIPFRCLATDILVGREAVFTHGPLAEAVRASISIPGVFPPLEDGGHIYVDGALTENLPTDLVKNALHADVVLAVSLPLTPPAKGDTASLLGILGRSFSVASWSNEVRSRTLADVIIEPIAPPGVTAADYFSSAELEKAGYVAATKMAPQLLEYRVSDEEWAAYLAHRQGRQAPPVGNIATVRVIAPTSRNAIGVRDTFIDSPGKPMDADKVDAKLNEARSDGRFDTDYFLTKPGQVINTDVTGPANVGRKVQGRELLHPEEKRGPGDETAAQMVEQANGAPNAPAGTASQAEGAVAKATEPGSKDKDAKKDRSPVEAKKQQFETVAASSSGTVQIAMANPPAGYIPTPNDVDLNLWVRDRPGGPPYLLLGGNIVAQTGGTGRATVDGVLTWQDVGTYKSEFRTRFRLGFLTEVVPEYYMRLGDHGFFVAPRLQFYRSPEYIWANQVRVAERITTTAGGGFDVGWAKSHFTEWRAGWQEVYQNWTTTTGSDGQPDFNTSAQTARLQYRYNNQDRAMVPLRGLRIDATAGMMHIGRTENVPLVQAQGAYYRYLGKGNTLSLAFEGGSFANRNVPDPFRFTLGGPARLTASSFDEYRGTDYVLARPSYFRRIASLPTPLGQSIYVLGTYEWGRMDAPNMPTVTQQDVFIGVAAETPIGAITFGPAFGDNGHRKLIFTLGRFF